jgi:hypothetical protein
MDMFPPVLVANRYKMVAGLMAFTAIGARRCLRMADVLPQGEQLRVTRARLDWLD